MTTTDTLLRRTPALLCALAPVLALACSRSSRPADAGGDAGTTRIVQAAATADSTDVRFERIRHVFGMEGKYDDGYFRVEFPRQDLHVRIGQDALDPDFEFTSYFGFAPTHDHSVLAMGEVVLTQDEVPAAVAEARRQGVTVTALHNHLIGEEPRILYMHVMDEGTADSVATRLRAVLARTAAPLRPADPEKPAADWRAIDAVLGPHEEAEGKTAEYEFPRTDAHAVHGYSLQSSGILETGTEVVFQDLGGGRAANTGEMYVLPREVEDVVSALEGHGLHVTAIHNHMLDETPRMYWVHWYATGDGPTLARGVAAALAATGSERKSTGK